MDQVGGIVVEKDKNPKANHSSSLQVLINKWFLDVQLSGAHVCVHTFQLSIMEKQWVRSAFISL